MPDPNTLFLDPETVVPNVTEERMLVAGQPIELRPGTSLATPEENQRIFGIGFKADLRGIVQLSPKQAGESAEQLYIFDRGENPYFEGVANVDPGKSTHILDPKERYVIMTEQGLRGIKSAVDLNTSYKFAIGYKSADSGDDVTIGRGHMNLRQDLSPEVSRNHLKISFSTNGAIKLEDMGSSNGTKLISPAGLIEGSDLMSALPAVVQKETSKEQGGIYKEFSIGKNIGKYEGAVDFGERGKAYVFTSTDPVGKQRRFFVYKSLSEGGWRSSQGMDDFSRFLKGGELARMQNHYTQETQLFPEFQQVIDRIDGVASNQTNNLLAMNAVPQLSGDEVMESWRDFARISTLYSLPDRTVSEKVAPLRPGDLTLQGVAKALGLQPKSREFVEQKLLNQVDEINHALQKSGLVPDFSAKPINVRHDKHELLGDVTKETYRVIKNGRPYEWVIAHANNGKRIWIDRIRLADTVPTAFGTDAEIIDSGILTSKPLEYDFQCDAVPSQYKVKTNHRHYTDITSFIGLLSPIKNYKQAKGIK